MNCIFLKSFLQPASNEKGLAMGVAIVILALLTFLGMMLGKMTGGELQASKKRAAAKSALYAADAGIEVGRAVLGALKVADIGNWDNLLAGNSLVGQNPADVTLDAVVLSMAGGAAGLKVGSATFSLAVEDNEDLDGSPWVDTDNIIILTATGTVGIPNSFTAGTAQIRTFVRYTGNDDYTQEHYDSGSTGDAVHEKKAVGASSRW